MIEEWGEDNQLIAALSNNGTDTVSSSVWVLGFFIFPFSLLNMFICLNINHQRMLHDTIKFP